jgi:hypothetical protein
MECKTDFSGEGRTILPVPLIENRRAKVPERERDILV